MTALGGAPKSFRRGTTGRGIAFRQTHRRGPLRRAPSLFVIGGVSGAALNGRRRKGSGLDIIKNENIIYNKNG